MRHGDWDTVGIFSVMAVLCIGGTVLFDWVGLVVGFAAAVAAAFLWNKVV